jgi:soluble lytic murein transglycosylase-like protein
MRVSAWIFFGTLAALPALAGEYATLTSGARMKVERHEQAGTMVRLYAGGGVIELPAASVAGFEEFAEPAAEALQAPPAMPTSTEKTTASDPSPADSNNPRDLIRDTAIRAGLPPEFVASVAKVESAFQVNAVSPKGAIGVMQLMPDTARAMGADPYDVRQNIEAGTRLLRELLIQYNGDVVKALAAYNAGPGAVARYGGLPPYVETRYYVNKVIGAYQEATGGN